MNNFFITTSAGVDDASKLVNHCGGVVIVVRNTLFTEGSSVNSSKTSSAANGGSEADTVSVWTATVEDWHPLNSDEYLTYVDSETENQLKSTGIFYASEWLPVGSYFLILPNRRATGEISFVLDYIKDKLIDTGNFAMVISGSFHKHSNT